MALKSLFFFSKILKNRLIGTTVCGTFELHQLFQPHKHSQGEESASPIEMQPIKEILTTNPIVSSVSFSIFVYNNTPVINSNINNDDQGTQARYIQIFAN